MSPDLWSISKMFLKIFSILLLTMNTSIFIFLFKQFIDKRKAESSHGANCGIKDSSLKLLCLTSLISSVITAFSAFVVFSSSG